MAYGRALKAGLTGKAGRNDERCKKHSREADGAVKAHHRVFSPVVPL
jgi:hypothetical protein